MVVHNPNNWHWVDKNCLGWSKDYLTEHIAGVSADDGSGTVFTVKSVSSVLGDCDVTQRKGKTLCIYDMKLTFAIEVSSSTDSSRQVLVTVPEFVHDQDETEYVFEIDADDRKSDLQTLLVPLVIQKLSRFQRDLISAHDQDVKHTTS